MGRTGCGNEARCRSPLGIHSLWTTAELRRSDKPSTRFEDGHGDAPGRVVTVEGVVVHRRENAMPVPTEGRTCAVEWD